MSEHDHFAKTGSRQTNTDNSTKKDTYYPRGWQSGKETRLFAPFIYKNDILPRQARDKHRESTQKRDAFPLQAREPTMAEWGAAEVWNITLTQDIPPTTGGDYR
jgi:hypothetical protein